MAETRDERALPAGRPPRTVRWWRVPLAFVLFALVVGTACAPWLLSDPGRMSRLVAAAVPELAGDVTFRAVRIGWSGPIVLEGVRIAPHDDTASPLAIARVGVENGLAAILASGGDLGRVRVEGLEADVVFDERRRSNLSDLFRAEPDEAPSSGRPPRRSLVRMRLEVDDAIVRIAGPWSPEPWTSDPIDIRATLGPAADGAWSEWTIDPVLLLAEARLEPAVARGVLAYAAPILENATTAGSVSGRFSLRLDGARLPVGRPADGTLAGMLTMHEVVVGPGPMVENLLAVLPVRVPAPPSIRITDGSRVAFTLADRLVTHEGLEFGLPLARAGQRLDVQSSGSVAIDDAELDLTLRLPIPADLPGDRPVLAALAGKAVSVGIRGTLGDPRIEFDGSFQDAAGDVVADLIAGLRTNPALRDASANGQTAEGSTADAVIGIVGGIVEELAKRRAERQAVDPGTRDPQPDRPLRLRDRRRAGLGPAGRPDSERP